MKISTKLEEMVADLVSDEKSKREEVEAVLSQIHSLTEAYFNPEEAAKRELVAHARSVPLVGPGDTPVTVDKELESMKKMWESKGMQPEEAERRAKGILGIE